MAENRVEGGVQAYCPECKEHGHYLTAHHMAPVPPPYHVFGTAWP